MSSFIKVFLLVLIFIFLFAKSPSHNSKFCWFSSFVVNIIRSLANTYSYYDISTVYIFTSSITKTNQDRLIVPRCLNASFMSFLIYSIYYLFISSYCHLKFWCFFCFWHPHPYFCTFFNPFKSRKSAYFLYFLYCSFQSTVTN